MKSLILSKIVELAVLITIYVLLWWGLSCLVLLVDYDFNLRDPQFIQLAIIVGFIFGVLFTVFVEKITHQKILIQHLQDHTHKVMKK